MHTMKTWGLLSSILLLNGYHQAVGQTLEGPRAAISIVGNAPKFKYFPLGGDEETTFPWLMVEINGLHEMNGSRRTTNSIASFASERSLQFTEVKEIMDINNNTMLNVNYRGETDKKALFEAQFFLAHKQDVQLLYGDTLVNLSASNMKFNLAVSEWPFLQPNNTLKFHLTVKCKNTEEGCDMCGERTIEKENQAYREIIFCDPGEKASSFMQFPLFAIIDGETKSIALDFKRRDSSTTYDIVLEFTHFSSSMLYDPITGVNNSASSQSNSGFFLTGCAAFIALFVLFT